MTTLTTAVSPIGRAVEKDAIISRDGFYRYRLTRTWGPGPYATWIMLNPSTADGSVDDQTIRKCQMFTAAWGLNGFYVVNLFAFRATDPKALKTSSEIVGPRNDVAIVKTTTDAPLVICAWGRDGSLEGRDRQVLELLAGRSLHVLGLNKDGSPKHPLYVNGQTKLKPWSPA